MTAAARIARKIFPPHRRVMTTTAYSTTCAMAVNETSGVPPRISTKSVPTAMMPIMA